MISKFLRKRMGKDVSQLKERFKRWAIGMVLFTKKFPQEPEFKAATNQMVRCAPSAAANYRAACRAKSTPDFIHKMKIVEEELDESMFWLEFIVALSNNLRDSAALLYREANELLSIVIASVHTARKSHLLHEK